ncbi:MarR family winged helix-turn-helix transcriptional regulator [Microbacterium terricola]|uniref:MarR family transcriptional regulator n=1 Tax=Microbacterium terricola TaxID=344163 RepID=A0ABM8E2K9_9MICO|nr:hypothetical protein [Microbacterium terricola]UYK40095.1 hypothetical protein OAU46_00145 [Microbacterium terricola]BDV32204.1 hypothetical protein Microterr_28640 [Microbacterium terricola]
MNTSENDTLPTDRRPLGFWLRTVDALLTEEFAKAFADADLTRRDWMLLNIVSGDVDAPRRGPRGPEGAPRKGKGARRARLAERGWIAQSDDGTWSLTDDGRAAKEQLDEIVGGIRARVAGAVSPEDFATTLASLEAIARELGWNEESPVGRRGFGRGRGFGPGRGFRHGFGHGHGFGPDAEFGHGHGFGPDADHGHGHGHGFGPRHGAGHGHPHPHHAEQAYERGFDAGFARGQASPAA